MLRAAWVVHAWVGCAVTPSRCTRRVATSMATRMYNRRSQTVSMWKKSIASRPLAWLWRKARQLVSLVRGAGPTRWWARIRRRSGERDLVAQACEFALDPPAAPAWIGAGHLQHQVVDGVADRGSAPAAWLCPVSADQAAVPGQ